MIFIIISIITVIIFLGYYCYFKHKKDIYSFKDAMHLVNLPIVILNVGGTTINFLLDTGSTKSMINESIIKNIKHKTIDNPNSIVGIEGKSTITSSCIVTYFEVNNKKYLHDCIVMDLNDAFTAIKKTSGVTVHGILGTDFFNKFKYIIDFNKLVFISQK